MLARCVIIRVHLSYSRRCTSIDPPTDTHHTIHITWWSMVKVARLSLLCFLENALAFISSVPRLILVKGLGHLLLLSYPIYFSCLLLFLLLKPKTPKYLPLSVCSPFLIQCHLSIPSAPRWVRHSYLSKSYN